MEFWIYENCGQYGQYGSSVIFIALRVWVDELGRENMERETGIEPATNGLGSRYSTIELLPLDVRIIALSKKIWARGPGLKKQRSNPCYRRRERDPGFGN